MNDNQHSPEPWHVGTGRGHHESIYGSDLQGSLIAYAARGNKEKDSANAERIVACVNACKELPTVALEAGVIAKLVKLAKASYSYQATVDLDYMAPGIFILSSEILNLLGIDGNELERQVNEAGAGPVESE